MSSRITMINEETVYTSFIGNDTKCWRKGDLDATQQEKLIPVVSPATNLPVCWFLPADESDVQHAISAASNAFAKFRDAFSIIEKHLSKYLAGRATGS